MATEKDFAALSALVCNPRSRNSAPKDKLLPPPGWSSLADRHSEIPQPGFDVRSFIHEQGDMVGVEIGAVFGDGGVHGGAPGPGKPSMASER